MQIILLILYHFVIFWLFPIASNEAIYGQPVCK
jgi:piezo-type mechanosensitive ion channel component 1/2